MDKEKEAQREAADVKTLDEKEEGRETLKQQEGKTLDEKQQISQHSMKRKKGETRTTDLTLEDGTTNHDLIHLVNKKQH